MFYSKLEVQETKNSSLALFGLERFEDFDSTGNTKLIRTGNEGLSTYRKGCETGWLEFNGHCYHKGQTKGNWSEAKVECRKMCSYLIEIESKEEAEWISATFLENVNCPAVKRVDCTAWTGLNDLDIEGTYVWEHSKAPLTFSNWHPRDPSVDNPNMALTRDCIDILREGLWNDRQCSHLNWVICEKSF
uniref:Low affinity immunoglobulin epsilon Fc receptor-like n=1 Tax=Crassostrea virginica TaxID=6565 RepID=A0A8B8C745_CRAVI|nr:low affinity immunoglobulin epsilon Fc receptor-like [Crassostrea virginica]